MKVSVDRHLCVGSGQCVLTDPDVFDQGEEDGIVVLLDAAPGAEHDELVEEAALVCPAQAITVED
ncbi:ferredoxin [Pseudonocardiaceae bacterium YIM PH 21723]|nr:ferredoxin [Pseudonocardiaceae bacterium YIM PH 21723]